MRHIEALRARSASAAARGHAREAALLVRWRAHPDAEQGAIQAGRRPRRRQSHIGSRGEVTRSTRPSITRPSASALESMAPAHRLQRQEA
jgi:hypothetical protein